MQSWLLSQIIGDGFSHLQVANTISYHKIFFIIKLSSFRIDMGYCTVRRWCPSALRSQIMSSTWDPLDLAWRSPCYGNGFFRLTLISLHLRFSMPVVLQMWIYFVTGLDASSLIFRWITFLSNKLSLEYQAL